jgi:hypothetical protein
MAGLHPKHDFRRKCASVKPSATAPSVIYLICLSIVRRVFEQSSQLDAFALQPASKTKGKTRISRVSLKNLGQAVFSGNKSWSVLPHSGAKCDHFCSWSRRALVARQARMPANHAAGAAAVWWACMTCSMSRTARLQWTTACCLCIACGVCWLMERAKRAHGVHWGDAPLHPS